jgi:hypothetical protein
MRSSNYQAQLLREDMENNQPSQPPAKNISNKATALMVQKMWVEEEYPKAMQDYLKAVKEYYDAVQHLENVAGDPNVIKAYKTAVSKWGSDWDNGQKKEMSETEKNFIDSAAYYELDSYIEDQKEIGLSPIDHIDR